MASVTITGGTFHGTHFGDNIYHVYVSGQTSDEPFDFDDYTHRVLERLHSEAAAHVLLDVEPIVTSVDDAGNPIVRTLVDAVTSARHMIVVAANGAGKTASLRYAATCGTGTEIRAYIDLARYRKPAALSELDSLLILVGEVMHNWASATKPPSIATLRRLLRERPVTLLFDGLNEVDPSIRGACLRAMCDLAFAFEACRIVFSTRPHGFEPPEGWTVFRLRELTDAQIARFLHAQGDDAAAAVVLDRLKLDDNPLLRLPLFLQFALRLAHRVSGGAMQRLGSRTSIVAAFVNELFRDERQPNADEDAMSSVLARLASIFQSVGQSLLLSDACERLGEDRAMLAALASRGFLQIDERYVRFWHHTIQEYFFAWEQQRLFATSKPLTRWWRVRRALARRADEDALAFLSVRATDRALLSLMRVAMRANISLATRWADDLATDGRAEESVGSFVRAAQQRLQTTALYSRITYARRPGLMGAMLAVDILLITGVVDALNRANQMSGLNAVLCTLPFLFVIAILHYLWRYRGCPDAGRLASAARGVRSPAVHRGLTAAFEAIPRSAFSSYELRQIALTVIHADRLSGDPLRDLETSSTPYLTIQLLGYDESPRALTVLKAVIEAAPGNIYSRAALLAMLERAPTERRAAELLRESARKIWTRREGWRLRRTAGRCLAALDPSFRARYRVTVAMRRTLLTIAFAAYYVFCVIIMYGVIAALQAAGMREVSTDVLLLRILVALMPLSSIAMAICAALLRSKRVYGYHGIDAWPWWAYFVWAMVIAMPTSPVITTGIFFFQILDIDRNARGLDLHRVRQLVEKASDE